MQLSDIDFNILEDCSCPKRWGAGGIRDRKVFRNAEYYFKIWSKSFLSSTSAAVGDKFVRVEGLSVLHGFQVGLYDNSISAAFVDWIYDEEKILRGYVTHRGECPAVIPDSFVDMVAAASFRCGWTYSDLKEGNVITFNGTTSLIDFDTHLVSLAHFDIDFEERQGCLRDHVNLRFKKAILNHVEIDLESCDLRALCYLAKSNKVYSQSGK